MDRRTFLSTFGVSLLAAPIAAEAQQTGKIARIGYLSSGTATANASLRKAFTDGLQDHGWTEDKNVAIEYRWEGEGKPTLDALAGELARLPLGAVLATNTAASLAMKRAGTTLPVVFATVSEPVAVGLVDSLPRPGRNFTGLTQSIGNSCPSVWKYSRRRSPALLGSATWPIPATRFTKLNSPR